jgi:hypothetical protein
MRPTALLSVIAALTAALLTDARAAGQQPAPEAAFVAFRFDGTRAIATLKVLDTPLQQITDGLSGEPMARFGYPYFEPPAPWREESAAGMNMGDRWVIHTGPGQAFQAETERIVGGNAGCQNAVGVLLHVVPEQAAAFTALSAKYFLAERAVGALPSRAQSTVAVVPSPSTAAFRQTLEGTLNALLARELPRVQAEAAPEFARMASSPVDYHRSWARQRQAVDDAMQRGRGQLRYDIQSFRLAPDGVPLHFVRAEWAVERRQGFASAMWLRGEQSIDTIETNLRPASWLRMFEFQGSVARVHQGLVLNVFDWNRDGWGEVLMAQGGYESMRISLLEYSPTGFRPTGIQYTYGC